MEALKGLKAVLKFVSIILDLVLLYLLIDLLVDLIAGQQELSSIAEKDDNPLSGIIPFIVMGAVGLLVFFIKFPLIKKSYNDRKDGVWYAQTEVTKQKLKSRIIKAVLWTLCVVILSSITEDAVNSFLSEHMSYLRRLAAVKAFMLFRERVSPIFICGMALAIINLLIDTIGYHDDSYTPAIAPYPGQIKACLYCGQAMPYSAKYCGKCGLRVIPDRKEKPQIQDREKEYQDLKEQTKMMILWVLLALSVLFLIAVLILLLRFDGVKAI